MGELISGSFVQQGQMQQEQTKGKSSYDDVVKKSILAAKKLKNKSNKK